MNDDENEIQELSLSNDTLNISNANTPIDLSGYVNDDENEIQELSLSNDTLNISNANTPIDLSGYLDNLDEQQLSLELDTLRISGDTTAIDLSRYDRTLETKDLEQTETSDRTYNINAGTLNFTNGNVGVGTAAIPTSTLQTGGSFAAPITTTSGDTTLNESHYTVILGDDDAITLPGAGTCQGRIYIIKNTTIFTPTISSYIDDGGTSQNTIPSGVTQLQSDGTNWQQIN